MTPRRSVHIVGAGIGGLTTAIALAGAGHDITVSERADGLSEVGAGITLWPNALRVLDGLGVGSLVRDAGRRHRTSILGTSRGRTLRVEHFDEADSVVAIHRAKLQAILYETLPAGTVVFGRSYRRSETASDGITVAFQDEATVRSDVVVGADGINSTVRRSLFDVPEPSYRGYSAFRGLLDDWAEQDQSMAEIWGPGRRFGIIPIGNGQLYWYATDNRPENSFVPAGARRGYLGERFEGWSDNISGIVQQTSANAILQHDVRDLQPIRSWSADRVVLIGDAIHPTTPNLGQGAAMAIEDSVCLRRCLDTESDAQRAFELFERTRAERTAKVTNLSRRIGRIGQAERRSTRFVRNQAIRFAPNAAVARQTQWLTRYDA